LVYKIFFFASVLAPAIVTIAVTVSVAVTVAVTAAVAGVPAVPSVAVAAATTTVKVSPASSSAATSLGSSASALDDCDVDKVTRCKLEVVQGLVVVLALVRVVHHAQVLLVKLATRVGVHQANGKVHVLVLGSLGLDLLDERADLLERGVAPGVDLQLVRERLRVMPKVVQPTEQGSTRVFWRAWLCYLWC